MAEDINLRQELEEIDKEDFKEREDFRKKLVQTFRSRIQPGRDLNENDKKRLIKSLDEWGLTPEDFSDCMGITGMSMWENFMSFMNKALSGELKAHREHMKKLEAGKKKNRKIGLDKFVRNTLGLDPNWQWIKIQPWLTYIDKAHFLNAAAEIIVEKGYFGSTNSGKLYYSDDLSYTRPDQIVTWYEGDETKSISTGIAYKIALDTGECFILNGLPTENGCVSHAFNVQTYDSVIVNADADIATIHDEIEKLYLEHCLFKNKITSVTIGERGAADFKLKNIPPKPAILDTKTQDKFDHIKEIIENWDILNKGERKKGLVLYGRPGTGKTASITQLVNEIAGKATIFYVSSTPAAFLSKIYPWLERIGPNIVIYEDMDAIQVRRDGFDWLSSNGLETQLIAELLNVLDGDTEYDVITIATTNYPDKFDSAVLRPGRLGLCVEYKPPTYEIKLKIIGFYVDKYNLSEHFDPESLLKGIFYHDGVLGSHIGYTLKDTAVKIRLGMDPNEAIEQIADQYMGEESLGWQRNTQEDIKEEKQKSKPIGFGK